MDKNNQPGNAGQQPESVKIKQLLHINDRQYEAFKMRCGKAFLQNVLHKYPQLVDEIIERQTYWHWWEKQYGLGDRVFLNAADLDQINTEILGAMYASLHNPYTLPPELLDGIIFEGLSFIQKPAI